MDHREPPRIASPEGWTRETISHVRKLAPYRLALASLACVGVVLLLVLVWNGLSRYVGEQPAYQMTFDELTLDPKPPPWYRGGKEAFLERVATDSKHPRQFSVLDLDLLRLKLAFMRPFVREVIRLEKKATKTIVVRLAYREPVALARFERDPGPAVDAEGVLLPRDEIDVDAAGPLVTLYNFPRPSDLRYGMTWSKVNPTTGLPEDDPQVAEAARLASEIRAKLLAEPSESTLRTSITIHCPANGRRYIQVGLKLMVLWNDPPSAKGADLLSDGAKWGLLRAWIEQQPTPDDGPVVHLKFEGRKLIPFLPSGTPDEPRRISASRAGAGGKGKLMSR